MLSRCRFWVAAQYSGIFLTSLCLAQTSSNPAPKPAPEDPVARHYQAARTFSTVGDMKHAAPEYRAFLGEVFHQMANARVSAGDLAAAYKAFDEGLAITPDDVELHLDYAETLLRNGDPEGAKAQAQKAVDLAPQNSKAQYLLGRVLFEQNDYKGAREHLEDAVKARGGEVSFDVGYDLATTYMKLDDLNRASLLFDEMLIGLGNTAQMHLYFGHAYLMTDHYDRAISEFKEALRKDPKMKEAHYFLGLAYLSKDEDNGWDENAAEDRAEIQNNPDDFRPHFDLGNIDLKRHNPEEAERELRRASEIQPDNPDPLIGLGEILISERKLPEAEAAMTRAIAITKDQSRNAYQVSRAYYVLGRVQVETGRRDQGANNLKIAAELREKAQAPQANRDAPAEVAQQRRATEQAARKLTAPPIVTPEQARQLDAYFDGLKPAIADAYNNLGVAAAGAKDYASAMTYFRKAGEWFPMLETLDRNLGMAAFYSGNYQEAILPLYHVIERDANDQRARTALGLSYFAAENYRATLETLRPIEGVVKEDPGAGAAYAFSEVKQGQYEQGVELLKSLEQANPTVAGLHITIGQVYADQGVYATAIDEYKKAIALDAAQPRTHFLLGASLLRDGKPADAVPEFRTALSVNPTDSRARFNLALALIQTQQKDEASSLLQQVIKQEPKYADAYYQLGKLELEGGNTTQSIAHLETAAGLSPTSDYIHYQLSLAYTRDSRSDDAQREMNKYQALKTQHRGDHEQPRSN